jgi:hypothetical protein
MKTLQCGCWLISVYKITNWQFFTDIGSSAPELQLTGFVVTQASDIFVGALNVVLGVEAELNTAVNKNLGDVRILGLNLNGDKIRIVG